MHGWPGSRWGNAAIRAPIMGPMLTGDSGGEYCSSSFLLLKIVLRGEERNPEKGDACAADSLGGEALFAPWPFLPPLLLSSAGEDAPVLSAPPARVFEEEPVPEPRPRTTPGWIRPRADSFLDGIGGVARLNFTRRGSAAGRRKEPLGLAPSCLWTRSLAGLRGGRSGTRSASWDFASSSSLRINSTRNAPLTWLLPGSRGLEAGDCLNSGVAMLNGWTCGRTRGLGDSK